MSRNDERSTEGLDALLEDVLLESSVDDDLLIAYADDRDALSDADRARVETALRDDPQVADQLQVLQQFDVATLQGETEEDAPPAAEVISLTDRLRGRAGLRVLAIALPIAAVLALVVLQAGQDAPEGGAPASGDPVIAEGGSDVPGRPPEPVTEGLVGGDPDAEPVELALEPDLAPEPSDARDAPASDLVDDAAEPVLLAFVDPVYSAPPGAAERFFEAPVLRAITVPPAGPRTLAPGHVGRTATPRPDLFWHTPHTDAGGGFHLTITEADSGRVLADRVRLPDPVSPGLQRIRLDDLGLTLPPGVEVVWQVERWLQADRRRGVQPAVGWIELAPLGPAARAELDALPPGQRAAWLAERGYWYDALAALEAPAVRALDPSRVEAARERLMGEAGLPLTD